MKVEVKSKEELKKCGLKSTKGRLAIIDVLKSSNSPLSAEEIHQFLTENKLKINLSTVYRSVDSLAQKGIISKINIINDEHMLYEYNHSGHRHHLICMECKQIISINNCPLHDYEKSLEQETDFKIEAHKLLMYGYCKNCQS